MEKKELTSEELSEQLRERVNIVCESLREDGLEYDARAVYKSLSWKPPSGDITIEKMKGKWKASIS